MLPFVAAIGWDGYSHISHYISELGAQGAPDGGVVSLGFVAVGILLLAATAMVVASADAPRKALVGIALVGGGLGMSYFVSGFARCDAGCPETGAMSTAQQVHNAVGVLGYVAAIAGVALASIAMRRATGWRNVAAAGLVAAPILVVLSLLTTDSEWRGALQRLIEVVLLAWFWTVARLATARPEEMGPSAGELPDQ